MLLHYIPEILFAVDFLLLKSTCALKGKTTLASSCLPRIVALLVTHGLCMVWALPEVWFGMEAGQLCLALKPALMRFGFLWDKANCIILHLSSFQLLDLV